MIASLAHSDQHGRAAKVRTHGHSCHRFVFVTNASLTASEKDQAKATIKEEFGWQLEIYDIERPRIWLDVDSQHIKKNHLHLFDPRLVGQSDASGNVADAQRINMGDSWRNELIAFSDPVFNLSRVVPPADPDLFVRPWP